MPPELHAAFWMAATVGIYLASRAVNRRHARWWTSPLLVTWSLCFGLAYLLGAGYDEYSRGTHWLVTLLGPATVGFALPVYERRALIRRHKLSLSVGVVSGCAIAIGTSWLLAGVLDIDPALRLSLLSRSVSTPFSLAFAGDVGGIPELAAMCTVITGMFGAAVGDALLTWLPLRTSFARGAMFGMGAHGAGVARAYQTGSEEGMVAALVMILAGLASVFAAPLLAIWLR